MKDLRSPRVFLSFAGHDRGFARQLGRELERTGVVVWTNEKLGSGVSVAQDVQRALRDSEFLVLVLSNKSSESPNLMFELGAAAAQAKRIIPVFRTRRARDEIPSFASMLRSVSAEGKDPPVVARRIRDEITLASGAAAS